MKPITLFVLLAAFAAAPAFAMPHEGRGMSAGHGKAKAEASARFMEKHAEEIGIGEETLAQIRTLRRALRDKRIETGDAINDARRELRKNMRGAAPDEAAAVALAQKLAALRGELQVEAVRTRVQIRKLLTEEQREKLAELREKKRTKKRIRRQRSWFPFGAAEGRSFSGGAGEIHIEEELVCSRGKGEGHDEKACTDDRCPARRGKA